MSANAKLVAPRRLLESYLREAAARMAHNQKIVGDRIRAARKEKHWLQKDLAARLHVEPQTVSNWERGTTAPDFTKLGILARELEKPVSYFLVEEQPVSDAARIAQLEDDLRETRASLDALADLRAAVARIEELLRGNEGAAQSG